MPERRPLIGSAGVFGVRQFRRWAFRIRQCLNIRFLAELPTSFERNENEKDNLCAFERHLYGLWHYPRGLSGCVGGAPQRGHVRLHKGERLAKCPARRRACGLRRSRRLHSASDSRTLPTASYEESERARALPIRKAIPDALRIAGRRAHKSDQAISMMRLHRKNYRVNSPSVGGRADRFRLRGDGSP
jgi:hypothetical protein